MRSREIRRPSNRRKRGIVLRATPSLRIYAAREKKGGA